MFYIFFWGPDAGFFTLRLAYFFAMVFTVNFSVPSPSCDFVPTYGVSWGEMKLNYDMHIEAV